MRGRARRVNLEEAGGGDARRPRHTIAHHLAHLAALARGHEKAAALAEGHKARGIDSAVEAFVRLTVKETVNTEDGTTER